MTYPNNSVNTKKMPYTRMAHAYLRALELADRRRQELTAQLKALTESSAASAFTRADLQRRIRLLYEERRELTETLRTVLSYAEREC